MTSDTPPPLEFVDDKKSIYSMWSAIPEYTLYKLGKGRRKTIEVARSENSSTTPTLLPN
jgi:hypothetical protein